MLGDNFKPRILPSGEKSKQDLVENAQEFLNFVPPGLS
jgi:hypothetical protein